MASPSKLLAGVQWRAAANVLGGSVATTAFGFLTSVVLARWLGPAGQGTLAILLVYPQLAQQITDMGVRQAAARAVGQQERPLGVIASTVLGLWALSAVIGVSVVCALLLLAKDRAEHNLLDVVLAALLLPCLCAQSYAGGILIGRKAINAFTGTRWIPAVAQLICVALAFEFLPPTPAWALAARLFALASAAGIAYWSVQQAIPRPWGRYDEAFALALLGRGASYGAATFVSLLSYRISILTLEWWSSREQIGYFSIAQATAEMLWQLPMAFGVVVFADSLSSRAAHENREQTLSSMRIAVWSGALLAAVAMLLAPRLVPLVYGAAFSEAALAHVALLPGVVAFMTFKVGAFDIVGQARPLLSVPVLLFGIVCNLTLARYLVPHYGALGAATATSIAYAVSGIGFLWLYRRVAAERARTS